MHVYVLCVGYDDGYEKYEYDYDGVVFESSEDADRACQYLIDNELAADNEDHYCFAYEAQVIDFDTWVKRVQGEN